MFLSNNELNGFQSVLVFISIWYNLSNTQSLILCTYYLWLDINFERLRGIRNKPLIGDYLIKIC
jgi:hypothetical protein